MGRTVDAILDNLIDEAGLDKEAMPSMGTPSAPTPPVSPAPIPGEEGVANPVAKAQERADQNPANEAMGQTDVATQRVKAKQELMQAAGLQQAAASRGDPEEQVSYVLKPMDETIATPAAPPGGRPGQLGEQAPTSMGTGDIVQTAAKMSSMVEEMYDESRQLAEDAQNRGDTTTYTKHAGERDAYLKLAQKMRDDEGYSKQATAEAALMQLLSANVAADGNGDGQKVAAAPDPAAEVEEPLLSKEAEVEVEQHLEKLADQYEAAGTILGDAASVAIMDKLAEFVEVLPGILTDALVEASERIQKGQTNG